MNYYQDNKQALNDLIGDLQNDNGISLIAKEDIESELDYANKMHKLEETIGCPLDVRLKVSLGTPVYIFVKLDMSRQLNMTTYRENESWKFIGDKILTQVIVISEDGLGDIKRPSFKVSRPTDFSTPCESFEKYERRLLWKDYNKTWWLSNNWWYKKDTKDWQKW